MNEKTVPSTRFDGFTNAWEQRKLGDLLQPNEERNVGLKFSRNQLLSAATMTDGKSNGNGDEGLENYRVMRIGDVVFEGNRHKARPMGQLTVNTYRDGIISPRFRAFRPVKPYNNFYWSYYLHDDRLMRKILIRSTRSGVLMNEMVDQSFLKESILLPSYSEQNRIASILLVVDSMLDLCLRKLDLLTQAKKALMQQIFSRKLRFKADDGSEFPDWEEKKLGDIASQLKKNLVPKTQPDQLFLEYSMPAFDENQTPHLSRGSEMESSRKILDKPCLLINKLNVRKQRIWLVLNPGENAVSSAEFVPFTSNQVDLAFLNYIALSNRFTSYLLDLSSGSSNSQKRVTPDVIEDYVTPLPSLPEQQKIASCLSSADALIDQARVELEQWREVKKSLLQQLFV